MAECFLAPPMICAVTGCSAPGRRPMDSRMATHRTAAAPAAVSAKMGRQSSERHAGPTPRVLSRRRVGFRPTRLLNAAGTRPEPGVSVPRLKLTRPAATATAEPELEPPGTYSGLNVLPGVP